MAVATVMRNLKQQKASNTQKHCSHNGTFTVCVSTESLNQEHNLLTVITRKGQLREKTIYLFRSLEQEAVFGIISAQLEIMKANNAKLLRRPMKERLHHDGSRL